MLAFAWRFIVQLPYIITLTISYAHRTLKVTLKACDACLGMVQDM